MATRLRSLAAVLLVACVTVTPPATTSREAAAPPARAPECPATFDKARSGASPCGPSFSGACQYAEGFCGCREVERCSGVPPPEPDPTKPPPPPVYEWTCETTIRSDGCPGAEPEQGAACSVGERSCSYGRCCVQQMDCRSGKWELGGLQCPP